MAAAKATKTKVAARKKPTRKPAKAKPPARRGSAKAPPTNAFKPGHLVGVATRWKPGQSGNPGGVTNRALAEATRRLAREHAPDAMQRVIDLMRSPDDRVALAAANSVLDRALGKPTHSEWTPQDTQPGGQKLVITVVPSPAPPTEAELKALPAPIDEDDGEESG